MKIASGAGRQCNQSVDANLCGAFVINGAYYGLQQLLRIYFLVVGGKVAYAWPEAGVSWFNSLSLGLIAIATFTLLWTVMLPIQPSQSQRVIHLLIVGTAALNLALAVGTQGLMATMCADGFADTPSNRIQRTKHLRVE